jgi:hypothetical protein
MAIPPSVLLLAGFAALVVAAFGARAVTDLALEVQFQIASLKLSFG